MMTSRNKASIASIDVRKTLGTAIAQVIKPVEAENCEEQTKRETTGSETSA